MISVVTGTVLGKQGNSITILTSGGVGYEVLVNSNSAHIWQVGQVVSILTYLAVRENALDLYGFANVQEKQLFEKFLLVSGIGPKTALHLLSVGTVQEISTAISRGDLTYLTKVSGIGKKTAERILVELKSKMAPDATGLGEFEGVLADVIEGLGALGYSIAEARNAVKDLDALGKSSEQLLREALQRIK
jgi:Holliday junction DNA helicase RuvA